MAHEKVHVICENLCLEEGMTKGQIESTFETKTKANETKDNLQSQINSLSTGSPKGVYATTEALKTANPDTGVYIVTSDGHIYSWTKNQTGDPIDLGVYQGTSNPEVDAAKVNYFGTNHKTLKDSINSAIEALFDESSDYIERTRTTQLFNKYDVVRGVSLGNNGQYVDNSGWVVTGYIPVTEGDKITRSRSGTAAFYDNDKNFVSFVNYTEPGTVTVPQGAYYFRTSIANEHIDTYKIGVGTSVYYTPLNYYNYAVKEGVEIYDAKLQNFFNIDTKKIISIPSSGYLNTQTITSHCNIADKYYFNVSEFDSDKFVRWSVIGYKSGSSSDYDVLATSTRLDDPQIVELERNYVRISLFLYSSEAVNNITVKYSLWYLNDNDILQYISKFDVESKKEPDYVEPHTNRYTSRIFKKVVCVGDSYTHGYICDENGTAHELEEYAWPRFMENITGNKYVNCALGGRNVLSWQTSSNCYSKALSTGKAQAYIIGLMINDSSGGVNGVPLGTSADIGTQAQTYYGGMSQIIDKLLAISPNAKIFIQTCPKEADDYSRYHGYNQAVKDVVAYYRETNTNIHCLDLANYASKYQNASLTGDAWYGHYTALGYEQFAEILNGILSDYINTHISEFRDVAFIEYDE